MALGKTLIIGDSYSTFEGYKGNNLMEKQDVLELIIIRHAEAKYDSCGDRDGCDCDLSEYGERQCIALGERLKDLKIDAYITSPLFRAFQTAAGVCHAKPDKPVLQIMPEIVECGVPVDYYGCSEEYLQKYYPHTKMCPILLGTDQYRFSTKYSCDNVLRAKKVIEYIKKKYSFGNRVVLFSHNGFCQYLIREALNIEKQTFDFLIQNTALTKIEFHRSGQIVLCGLNL